MIQAPAQQLNTARHIARSAQRQIKNKTGMSVTLMLRHIENTFETPEEMLEIIAMALGMSPDCYRMKTRIRDVVELRFIAALLLRMHFPRVTLTRIAVLFGGQDHTSILSGIASAYNLIHTGDTRFACKYDTVLKAVDKWLRGESRNILAISA